jgi:hypothetical protein
MGSQAALDDFIAWSVNNYPAHKYMLVIWNHGQGWRFQMAEDRSIRSAAASTGARDVELYRRMNVAKPTTPVIGGYRAVSFDDDTGHLLYNSDVQQSLQKAVARLNRKIDVLGFDACLMSMLETAYELRNVAAFMVASEELEPGPGWDYAPLLKALVALPSIGALDLSKAVVAGYQARYGDNDVTTLSVLDLSRAQSVATAVSGLADGLRGSLASERSSIQTARSKLTPYGADDALFTSIDLGSFLQLYLALTTNPDLKKRAQVALDASNQIVLSNYASKSSTNRSGSKGVAIYFPATKSDFDSDPYKQGYEKNNADHQVEFVARERWADFLGTYLQ